MNNDDGLGGLPPAITTRAELDHLRETRAAPASEQHLRPSGPDTTEVHQRLAALHENRIAEIETRLQNVRDGFERDHAFAQVQDRAGADFERSR